MDKKILSFEEMSSCHAKAKANGSHLEQEIFLAKGGTLLEWYNQPNPALDLTSTCVMVEDECSNAVSRAAAYRMAASLMVKIGRPLHHRELVALCLASRLVGKQRYEAERNLTEHIIVRMASAMVLADE